MWKTNRSNLLSVAFTHFSRVDSVYEDDESVKKAKSDLSK